MSDLINIGTPPWTRSEIVESIDEFSAIYNDRPIKDNLGGMKAPHMFAVWFVVRKLSPDLIVESGIWKGQSTWLLEKACPTAKLVSIDLNLGRRQYISDNAIYSDKDFSQHDWSEVTDRSLAFFDDHQNAYTRLQQCKWFRFQHIMFEDNYPVSKGDCYSLKKAFANAGYTSTPSLKQKITGNRVISSLLQRSTKLLGVGPSSFTPLNEEVKAHPNNFDAKMLHEHLDVYYEFPPVFKAKQTRWGDEWNDTNYPTPEPLLNQSTHSSHEVFLQEAMDYTWICYAKLKSIG